MSGENEGASVWEGQHIEYIPFEKLALWSENPRDPIDPGADNAEVIENALHGKNSDTVWKLDEMARQMGETYDLSQLPIVVHDDPNDKYVVFDGNRRVALALIRRGDVPGVSAQLPLFPEIAMPCNVCSREKAISLVYRKHASAGTWSPYQRELFCSRYMDEPEGVLSRLQRLIGAIDKYPELNQRYVSDDVLNQRHLAQMGLDPNSADFGVPANVLEDLVRDIVAKIESKALNTRGSRSDPVSVLDKEVLSEVENARRSRAVRGSRGVQEGLSLGLPDDAGKGPVGSGGAVEGRTRQGNASAKRKTPATKPKALQSFGGILSLAPGDVSNLYRTLDQLWRLHAAGTITETVGFIGLFRAGLRLLVEAAAKERFQGKNPIDRYVEEFEGKARSLIRARDDGDDVATFMNSNAVKQGQLVPLLHEGAHTYAAAQSPSQALAMSILIGAMLSISHGKAGK